MYKILIFLFFISDTFALGISASRSERIAASKLVVQGRIDSYGYCGIFNGIYYWKAVISIDKIVSGWNINKKMVFYYPSSSGDSQVGGLMKKSCTDYPDKVISVGTNIELYLKNQKLGELYYVYCVPEYNGYQLLGDNLNIEK